MTNENDVERLKKKCPPMAPDREIAEVRGWNHCIDHLTASGRLAGWRPIESAPRDGTYIILHRSKQRRGTSRKIDIIMGRYSKNCWKTINCYYAEDKEFTHWMPLPPAPSARKEG